jgi:hypothetical protein
VHQVLLISAGNYAWLNFLTIVLGVTAFSDSQLAAVLPIAIPLLDARAPAHDVLLAVLAGMTVVLSIPPTFNFFSRNQLMNFTYNPLHLVNAYGAFGSVTRERCEIIVEGTSDTQPGDESAWEAYEFKGKPGDPMRRPPQVAPYHLRLDWLMWFLPLTIPRNGDVGLPFELWFLRLIAKLLEGDRSIATLLRRNPFQKGPPRFLRVRMYRYAYTDWAERRATGAWWKRSFVAELLPPITLGPGHLFAAEPAPEAT